MNQTGADERVTRPYTRFHIFAEVCVVEHLSLLVCICRMKCRVWSILVTLALRGKMKTAPSFDEAVAAVVAMLKI
jgi:hypothetical protein